jgi:hypothetical protein
VRTGPLDGFVAAKGVELIVDVVHLVRTVFTDR